MNRKIITWKHYFNDFISSITDRKVKEKIAYSMQMLKQMDRLPSKFVKHLRAGVYELRVEWGGNIFRVLFCFDEGNIVVLFQGFQKKTQKTPESEIEKAIRYKKEYEEDKRKHLQR